LIFRVPQILLPSNSNFNIRFKSEFPAATDNPQRP
jgi:hypothetical protein